MSEEESKRAKVQVLPCVNRREEIVHTILRLYVGLVLHRPPIRLPRTAAVALPLSLYMVLMPRPRLMLALC